ncbi:MAG TPA: N-acetylmuramoyl-L-alanine amidase [Bacteroidales bacterium]|nr:N-acetylmuramoyl-L-alanine amidase [Bacteroidales bacterium]
MKALKNIFFIIIFHTVVLSLVAQDNDSIRVVVVLQDSIAVDSIKIDSFKTVVAKQGDGIYKILRENGYPAKDYYNKFLELNKDKIKEYDNLILGETYLLPVLEIEQLSENKIVSNDSLKRFPDLMYADTICDDLLKGAVIYLISGHGGPDPGAVAIVDGNTLCEDEFAYDICLRIAVCVEEHGGKAYMIIDDPNDGLREDKYLKVDYDEYCWPDLEIPRDQNLRLKQRADAVNNLYEKMDTSCYQRVVEIHLDSRQSSSTVDVFFYYFPGSTKGKLTAESIQNVFVEKYAKYQPNRRYTGTVGERSLLVMKKVLPPEVFMELGNIQNENDRKRVLDPENRQAIAKWITEGLINDFVIKEQVDTIK